MSRGITEIEVERLFGRYDYRIRLADGDHTEVPRISLLYGDNGTGKTTILQLIFHLISPSLSRGHRSYVARTPFQRFSISFSDGTRVATSRPSNKLSGAFRLELVHCEGRSESADVEIDPESRIVTSSSLSEDAEALLSKVAKLAPDVFYLGDSRDLEGDTIPQREGRLYEPEMLPGFRERYRVRAFQRESEQPNSPLIESIRRTERWLKNQMMRASSSGETDARQSYAGILRTIASASAPAEDADALDEEVGRLKRELGELQSISTDFAEFGLGSVIDAESLLESLARANKMTLPVVVQVFGSFLDGQRARLNALRGVYEKLRSFVGIANEYLTDKTVKIHVYDGFTVQLPSLDQELNPDFLSSGEKQLLLLFLNVFTASDQSPLFIIDEPELSLNVKWQRKLVDSLLELSENSNCQFLLATHSIELLAKHREYVVVLNSHE